MYIHNFIIYNNLYRIIIFFKVKNLKLNMNVYGEYKIY